MPLPLKPYENIYIDHQIKDADYSMPTMQAAPDHYTIGYIVTGDRRWISTETIRTCHAGDCGITKPHVYHRNCSMSDTPYERYVLKVRPEIFQPIIDIIGETELNILCQNYLRFTKESQKIIHAMYDEILNEYTKNSPYSQLILQGMVYKLFFYMYENHIPSELDKNTLYVKKFDERIHNALIYIENNLTYGSPIEEVAASVSLSPSHFSRLFKSVTGSSYTDYLTDVRLQHAQILLGTTSLSISEIATKLGLANGNYLCTLFKKKYGVAPTEYRRELEKYN
ncbi:MAG: helix-turn-helix transcriptional regulator [Lachnospiraceae bacterium]|nr:helix-turn-helix transcriptional regulator [Lachnospiraceae bacterium]